MNEPPIPDVPQFPDAPLPTAQLSTRVDWELMKRLKQHQRNSGGTHRSHVETALREYLERRGA